MRSSCAERRIRSRSARIRPLPLAMPGVNMPEPALTGIKVVAFEQAAAGPFGSHVLADMGAEVIKIERPKVGDLSRGWDAAVAPGISSAYAWLNRRKRSVTVDARKEAGRAILKR